jgi:hypothetical protein
MRQIWRISVDLDSYSSAIRCPPAVGGVITVVGPANVVEVSRDVQRKLLVAVDIDHRSHT